MSLRSLAFVACLGTTTLSATVQSAGPPREPVASLQEHPIPSIVGKNLAAVVVDYQPGRTAPPYLHRTGDLIYAYVLSGAIRSEFNDEPAKIYRTGDSWFELSGTRHKISENASATEPARLLIVSVVDAGDRSQAAPGQKAE